MLVRKDIMYATINVLNSGFFYDTGIQHEKYLFHKALSYRFNKKKGEEFLGKKPKNPPIEFILIMAL
jgi:hypothetical protein